MSLQKPSNHEQGQLVALWSELNNRKRTSPKPFSSADLEVLKTHIPEGDFTWGGEPGEWHVYSCGDKDCDRQWHLVAYYEDISRNNGVLTIDGYSVDEDGNHDLDFEWHDGDDLSELYSMSEEIQSAFFLGWAEYWINAAETGLDPCSIAIDTPSKHDNWPKFCINAAKNMLVYDSKGETA
jgi:hypothetical protein